MSALRRLGEGATELTKAEAWSHFRNLFLNDLKKRAPALHDAFANPTRGSKGEAVILAMRSAWEEVYAMDKATAPTDPEPSGAWDNDFGEKAL